MIIREATTGDVPKIVPIWRELMDFHAERDGFYETCDGADEAFSAYVTENIENNDALVLVAELDGRCIGYCQCRIEAYPPVFHIKQYGQISDIAVSGEHRRTGIGEKMVARAMEWFRSKDLQRIEVRVAVSNEVSTQFWRKMGFTTYLETMNKQIDL